MSRKNSLSRRKFISNAAVIGAAGPFAAKELLASFSGIAGRPDEKAKISAVSNNFWFIPATHWEGAVFKTREQYLEMGLPHILTALKLLNDYPDYRFTLDQVAYVKPFLERYPEEAATFKQFVKEGRLEIVGATDVMHDANIPCGESIVRQMLYGKTYYRDVLGVDVKVGWALDTFGHNAQMPQLLKLAGYTSYWFQRGVPNNEVPSEWLWEGIDGTQMPAYYLPRGYGLMGRTPDKLQDFAASVKKRYESLNQWSNGADRVGIDSLDVEDPNESVPVMVSEFAKLPDKPFNLILAVPSDFTKIVNQRRDRQVLKGELNPIFQGAYSSRIELKQKLRNIEKMLVASEKLGAIGNILGKSTTEDAVWEAWEPALFNQAHDLMAGVMTDQVYEDTIFTYNASAKLGKEILQARLDNISALVNTSGNGVPLFVFNPLGWVRDDIVETTVGFTKGGVADIEITDPSGKVIPVEVISAERFKDGGLKNAKIIFLAKGVPALGEAVYKVNPLSSPSKLNQSTETEDGTMENDFYNVRLDTATGAITGIELKSNKWQVLDQAGNVVVHQYDGGDLWELYENLKGGSNINMTRKQPVPVINVDQFSTEFRGERGKVHRGPVYSEYRLAPHRYCADGAISFVIRTFTGIPRIEVQTWIENNEKFVRYQVMFPTTIKNGKTVHEIPFGSIERPNAIEFPAQNWADYSDGSKGLAVLNRGIPGNLTSDSTMLLSLMRSARIASYGYGGGYERGMSSDTGLQMGANITFDYALVAHEGDWKQAQIYRQGQEYNNPLICRNADAHAGKIPNTWGLLEVSKPNVVITSLKPSRDGSTVLRLYEASGEETAGVTLNSKVRIVSVNEASLIEDTGAKVKTSGNSFLFDLKPFEIKTFKIKFQG